jgi:hypothetical protein
MDWGPPPGAADCYIPFSMVVQTLRAAITRELRVHPECPTPSSWIFTRMTDQEFNAIPDECFPEGKRDELDAERVRLKEQEAAEETRIKQEREAERQRRIEKYGHY